MSKAEKAKSEIERKVKDTQSPHFRRLLTDRILQEIEQGTPELKSHRGTSESETRETRLENETLVNWTFLG